MNSLNDILCGLTLEDGNLSGNTVNRMHGSDNFLQFDDGYIYLASAHHTWPDDSQGEQVLIPDTSIVRQEEWKGGWRYWTRITVVL